MNLMNLTDEEMEILKGIILTEVDELVSMYESTAEHVQEDIRKTLDKVNGIFKKLFNADAEKIVKCIE